MKYVFRCRTCPVSKETMVRSPAPKCARCGRDMPRDYQSEAVNVQHVR